MPSYHSDRYYHRDGYDVAYQIRRDLRHSHRSTQYIINEGKLIVDERSFEDRDRHHHHSSSSRSNTVIINTPGSTMWIEKRRESRPYYAECRGCFRRADHYHHGGYCYDCVTLHLESPRRGGSREIRVRSTSPRLEYTERRALPWRER
ncbi:hypothetical protein GGS24DRAFT_206541 [Hypoxylon argillaceum]|nr:hypothetical protein GGS24DRAFT_206541 [Hypoxylon argillaceum]KAI1147849.1 hypothetical protein F4825DRAFT_436040 [Nemania diffusa]